MQMNEMILKIELNWMKTMWQSSFVCEWNYDRNKFLLFRRREEIFLYFGFVDWAIWCLMKWHFLYRSYPPLSMTVFIYRKWRMRWFKKKETLIVANDLLSHTARNTFRMRFACRNSKTVKWVDMIKVLKFDFT